MSIKYGLLALLERGQAYGYQLRASFEESTGSTWPLNIGQVYTTLARLERDGLVQALGENPQGQRPYEITMAGRAALATWFATPVGDTERPRDELAIKLALALSTPGVDITTVVQTQRTASVRALQEYTRLKNRATGGDDISWLLIIDAMIFRVEAEVRWLDHCEASLLRHQRTRPKTSAATAGAPEEAPESVPTTTGETTPR